MPDPQKASAANDPKAVTIVKTTLITISITMLFNLLVAWQTAKFQLSQQRSLADYQKRQQICTLLRGNRYAVTQAWSSVLGHKISQQSYKAGLQLHNNNQILLDELRRNIAEDNTRISDFTKNRRELFEILSSIRILFNTTDQLNRLIAKIKVAQVDELPGMKQLNRSEDVDQWVTESEKKMQEQIENRLGKAIDELAEYLEAEAYKDVHP